MDDFLLIHGNNVNVDLKTFKNRERVKFADDVTIESHIVNTVIPKINKKESFKAFLIKDNLSSNYLEFLGIYLAHYIRLSSELGEKRYFPIFIITDLNSYILNKLEPLARILFTKNVFIVNNKNDEIMKIKGRELKSLTFEQYRDEYLSQTKIEPPKDYLSHHSIANEWSIDRWAETLNVKSDAIQVNRDKISAMLYFQYLKQRYASKDSSEKDNKLETPKEAGKILLIDDEWNRGWHDALCNLFEANKKIEFKSFEYDYKDANKFTMHRKIEEEVKSVEPDVVVLDLRLAQSDHNEGHELDSYSGIRILNKIHEINAGIQVIMLTATSKSSILEKLYEYKILGYIKKEHPDDIGIDTIENINKFSKLVDEGLERKYLKEVFDIKNEIIEILESDPFDKFNIRHDYIAFKNKMDKEIKYVFNILEIKIENKYIYAMVSIVSFLESIISIFIKAKYNHDNKQKTCRFWDRSICNSSTFNSQLLELFYDKFHFIEDNWRREELNFRDMIKKRNDYLHANIEDVLVDKKDILSWLQKILKITKLIRDYKKSPKM